MKNKFLFLFICSYFFTNCNNSSNLEKIKLDSTSLPAVTQNYDAYRNLVSLRVNFMTQINENFAKSSVQDTDQMGRILKSYGTIENLVQNSSKSERAIFSKLSLDSKLSLKDAYEKLVIQLGSKYEFNEDLLQSLLVTDVSARLSSITPNGRVAISCVGQCSNGAEAYYWRIYNSTRSSDLAAYGAESYMAGCVTGCNQK
jgi:hypothetical protein